MGQDADAMYMQAYYDSPYTYCDAEALANFWEEDVAEAKWTIGYKVSNGWEGMLADLMRQAREQAVAQGVGCQQYTTHDANLSEYEGGEHDMVGTDDHWHQWKKSGLTYCDAQVLAAMWGVDEDAAKIAIGRKFGAGTFNDMDLVRARESVLADGKRCALHESYFTTDDAHMLASFWRKPVPETKLEMEMMLTRGESEQIWEAMNDAKTGLTLKQLKKQRKKEAKRERKRMKREKAKIW